MSKSEEITQLAEQAAELVKNLQELIDRAGHYDQAKRELSSTREELGKLIQETAHLTLRSREILDKLNQIEAGAIIEHLAKLNGMLERVSSDLQQQNTASSTHLMKIESAQKTNRILLIACLLITIVIAVRLFRT